MSDFANASQLVRKDFLLNIAASFLLTAAMQLICYPVLANVMDAEAYGLMLLCMGVVNVAGVALGSSLNNGRLLKQHDYVPGLPAGDFNRLVVASVPLAFFFCAVVCSILLFQSPLYAALEGLISVFVLLRGYYSVRFRLEIDYIRIFKMNAVGALGYASGSCFAYITEVWPLPFLFGEFLSVLYTLVKSPQLREGFSKTPYYDCALRVSRDLFSTSIISNLTIYFDRFLVFPVLGAQMVTCYTVASLLGKMIAMVASPVSGVLLTYYTKSTDGITRGVVAKRFIAIIITVLVSTGFAIILSDPVLHFLYPSLAEESLPYSPLASLASIALVGGNMLQPTMLIVCDTKLQPVIQGVHLILLVGLGCLLALYFGLYGFCFAAVVANTVRLLLMYALTWRCASR